MKKLLVILVLIGALALPGCTKGCYPVTASGANYLVCYPALKKPACQIVRVNGKKISICPSLPRCIPMPCWQAPCPCAP